MDEDKDDSNTSAGAIKRFTRRFLQKHPDFERLIPDMLDRGDTGSQRLALIIAQESQRQEVKETLFAYVRGARGTDEVRRQLLMNLKEQGHSFDSPIPMYVRGKVDQIEMLLFTITDEPSVPESRSDENCDLLRAANEALNRGDGAKAERLLRKIRQTEPDQPDVLNNLGAALQIQHRFDEADLLFDEVVEKHPEYFFGKVAMANRMIHGKQFDEAQEILVDLQRRDRLHFTEFQPIASSMIYANVGRRDYASAQNWLDMLIQSTPNCPAIASLSQYLASQRGVKKLLGRMCSRS